MLVVLATARTKEISWRFLRLVGFLVLALSCGVTFWLFRQGSTHSTTSHAIILSFGALSALGAAAIAIMAPRAAQRAMIFTLVTASTGLSGIAAASIMALHSLPSPNNSALIAGSLTIISQCLTAMLAGSITVTWLLGHAYLTATKMTVAPLRRFSRVLSLSVGLRLVFLLTSLLFAWFADSSGGAPPTLSVLHTSIWNQLFGAWLLVTLRVGIGLFAVAVFAYMINDCVRLRATQSATGILYFGSVFVYVGELANQQLMIECGWPL